MPLLIFESSGGQGQDLPTQIVSLLTPADEGIENPISSIISEYLPAFVRDNHSGFVNFVEAYYEWLEKKANPYGTSATLMDTMDIDRTLDTFIDYFKETYLHDFPKTFAESISGNKVNQKNILKNINDFYKAKGTEKSYQLLFRILHDSDVSFYYPKQDLLRVSDGKWVEKKSIKITSQNGTQNFDMKNRLVQQVDSRLNGAVTAYANVDNVYQYDVNQYKITELFLTDINGVFNQGSKLKCTLSDGTELTEDIFGVPTVPITISNGGAGYKVGDSVEIDTTSTDYVSGSGAVGSVTRVSNTGIIQTAQIDNFGVNYASSNAENTLPVVFKSGSGFGATGYVDLDALCTYPGYYANNDGKVSSNKRIRDNDLYQEYSYVLKTEISLDAYKEQIKKLVHPAGTKLFGNISILDTVTSTSPYSTQLQQKTKSVVGRYAPYTFETHDNLRGATGSGGSVDLYPKGFNPGATSPNHCLANTGGRIGIQSTGDGGFTIGSFRQGEGFTAASGATGVIFGWHRNSATGGALLLYTAATGGTLGFTSGETITATGGMTASVTSVQLGNGTVYEFDSHVHVTGGAALTAGATAYGATAYWDVQSSPIVASGTTEVITVQKFTTTSGYTAGYDFTIGNVVTQGSQANGNLSRGIVKDWIPGASGSSSNTLKIQLTSGNNFSAGTINEIDNRTGSISVSYTVSGSMTEETTFRNKVKHLKMDDFLTLAPTWQYHSDHGYTI
mgnify:CR=1 FL=1